MQLTKITVSYFKNFVEPQAIDIESDVTTLVGKNESGKTTVLQALHRLNPANGSTKERRFDLTTEYPRWRLARDRRKNEELAADTWPIIAEFLLDEKDQAAVGKLLAVDVPAGTTMTFSKSYANKRTVGLKLHDEDSVKAAAHTSDLAESDAFALFKEAGQSLAATGAAAKQKAKELKESVPLESKAWTHFANQLGKLGSFGQLPQEVIDLLVARTPKTFYFSNYQNLPGEANLTDLARKIANDEALTSEEETVVALLEHAGEEPSDFLDEDYISRKAELQAASSDLSRHAFEYWRQNTDLAVTFDTDNVSVGKHPNVGDILNRLLKIQLRDGRHGDVETNFETRSTGFRWFFSFFAAFSAYQESDDPLVVLLDEPGTSLHGDAQKDFVRFIAEELASTKQTIYTTHSQHMVDPTKYEKLRAVHDRATRDNPDLGVVVSSIDLAADKDTILPVESALGYSVSQHLFLGAGQHLAVEGSSDFVYLQRMTEHLVGQGGIGLDPRLALIPVGGTDNMPAFVALLGRRLKVTALIDGARTSNKVARITAAAVANNVPTSSIVVCADAVETLPRNADIEDLFDIGYYLKLYNWAFAKSVKASDLPVTSEPVVRRISTTFGDYDHALPAHALTSHRAEFFDALSPTSGENFAALFVLLNATVVE